MARVIIISGPIGAGKSTVARELAAKLPRLVSYIEGDKFWSFIEKSENREPRENFQVIMRAMTAAAIPFVRSGFEVVLDFSIPPQFLAVARKILKEVQLEYVILRPSQDVCAARAAARKEGAISDYSKYSDFYRLFNGFDQYTISDEKTDVAGMAAQVLAGLKSGKFYVP